MELVGYPGLAGHRAHHGELLERANADCERARTGHFAQASDLESFYDSIIDDALRADLPFKSYLQDRGLIPS